MAQKIKLCIIDCAHGDLEDMIIILSAVQFERWQLPLPQFAVMTLHSLVSSYFFVWIIMIFIIVSGDQYIGINW